MDLYVIRHAEAVELGQRGTTTDEERMLTEKGELQAVALGAALPKLGVRLELLLTSPLVRARQTAEGIARQWSPGPLTVQECPALAPDIKRRRLANIINLAGRRSVGVVGHEPSLSVWTAWLIGSKKARLDFAKAAVALVRVDGSVDKGAGRLVWFVPPEWFVQGL